MWDNDLDISLVVHSLIEEIERFSSIKLNNDNIYNNLIFAKSTNQLRQLMPNITDNEIVKIIQIACGIYNTNKQDKVEVVVTAPTSFKIKARKTIAVIHELISNATQEITITGYSISDYVDELLQLVTQKSRSGVYVDLYINDIENKEKQLKDLMMYKGKFLRIYNFEKQQDKMAALHAKVIVVDNKKTFITSSNLSFHGIIKNIEMGVLITSESKSKIIQEIFRQMVSWGTFTRM
jgi:phosphatidylserine/phosphatidylglycerophosphate/cardiolipin synthase-like enzyme